VFVHRIGFRLTRTQRSDTRTQRSGTRTQRSGTRTRWLFMGRMAMLVRFEYESSNKYVPFSILR
jgi:hypothetical protein